MPADPVEPMLATLTADRFDDPDWLYERKLDGVRCLAQRERSGAVRLRSRNDQDLSATFPEIVEVLAAQGSGQLLVDGEIVAFAGRRTSFARLQGRLGIDDAERARASGVAVYYYVFDVLRADGRDTRGLPLRERKKVLRRSLAFADPLRFTVHRVGHGLELYRRACARGDEGVIAKRAAAPYAAGRSRDWLKFKCVREQELVIGGWTEPQGGRTGFGALLLGYYDGAELVYAGKVGTGFGAAALQRIAEQLGELAADRAPFRRPHPTDRAAHWVRPELVAQIGFSEWTRDGRLRHPRFVGMRTDKPAAEVVRERAT